MILHDFAMQIAIRYWWAGGGYPCRQNRMFVRYWGPGGVTRVHMFAVIWGSGGFQVPFRSFTPHKIINIDLVDRLQPKIRERPVRPNFASFIEPGKPSNMPFYVLNDADGKDATHRQNTQSNIFSIPHLLKTEIWVPSCVESVNVEAALLIIAPYQCAFTFANAHETELRGVGQRWIAKIMTKL